MTKTYLIDADDNITAYSSPAAAPAGLTFSSAADLHALAAEIPMNRLVEVWNSLPGVTPVKKFENRTKACNRIFKTIDALNLAVEEAPAAEPALAKGKAAKKVARKANSLLAEINGKASFEREWKSSIKGKKAPAAEPAAPKAGSRQDEAIALMRRPQGATIEELMSTFGWQRHTVRGFVAGACRVKLGLTVESFKSEDGTRTYRIPAEKGAKAKA